MNWGQAAPKGTVWSGCITFASMIKFSLKCTWIYSAADVKSRRHIQDKDRVNHAWISMAFRWRSDDGPLIFAFWFSLPHKLKKNVVKVGPPLTKLSGYAHVNPQKWGYFCSAFCKFFPEIFAWWAEVIFFKSEYDLRPRFCCCSNLNIPKKSKWVRSGNTTITHWRPTHGTVRKSFIVLTVTRYQQGNYNKATSSLFLVNSQSSGLYTY